MNQQSTTELTATSNAKKGNVMVVAVSIVVVVIVVLIVVVSVMIVIVVFCRSHSRKGVQGICFAHIQGKK